MWSLTTALRENLPRRKRLAFVPRALPQRYDFELALKAGGLERTTGSDSSGRLEKLNLGQRFPKRFPLSAA
jgi:hypothetical protein